MILHSSLCLVRIWIHRKNLSAARNALCIFWWWKLCSNFSEMLDKIIGHHIISFYVNVHSRRLYSFFTLIAVRCYVWLLRRHSIVGAIKIFEYTMFMRMYREGTKGIHQNHLMHRGLNMDACNRVALLSVFVSLLSIIKPPANQDGWRNFPGNCTRCAHYNIKSMISSWRHCHSAANYLTSRFNITHDVCIFWLCGHDTWLDRAKICIDFENAHNIRALNELDWTFLTCVPKSDM